MNFCDMNDLITEAKKAKKEKKDTVPKKWKGTVAAMKQKHSDKFDSDCKDPDKLCPYAVANAMDKKGAKPGYEPQEDTKKKPKEKKEDKKDEAVVYPTFSEWMELKEVGTTAGGGGGSTGTNCISHFARPVGIGHPSPVDDDKKKKNEKSSVIRRNFA